MLSAANSVVLQNQKAVTAYSCCLLTLHGGVGLPGAGVVLSFISSVQTGSDDVVVVAGVVLVDSVKCNYYESPYYSNIRN